MKPVNGKNPLVVKAAQIHLPMPYEDDPEEYGDEDWDDDENGEGWDTSAWEDSEMPEPRSEDEQYQGVNRPPPPVEQSGQPARKPKRRRRQPPMPRVPKPPEVDVWEPPFEVLPDGTVTGPTVGDGDTERLPAGFDPAPGTFEGVTSIFRPPGSSGGENLPR